MWIIFSILTAFFYAAKGAWSKKVTRIVNTYTVTWSMFTFAIPILAVPLAVFGIPDIQPNFYWSCLGSLIINMVAVTIFVEALKISPLSMTFPFLTFTPVFLIFTGFIFLGEFPSIAGIFGILVVTIGAYVLNIRKMSEGLLVPFKLIIKEKGSLLMLIVAFLWSFSAAMDKVAVLSSSPYFYIFVFCICFFIFYIPFLVIVNPKFINEVKRNYIKLSVLGVFGGLLLICQMTAVKIAFVSYVIAIKRAGIVFSLIFGWMFFKEKLTVYKIIGTLIMIAGMLMITVFN